jgi:DNA-directed RNA polymerase specialized sigma24 family protein
MSQPASITPDGSLLRQIASGDAEAAQQFYHRHSGSLYALAYSVLMDPVDADVVVEATFDQARQGAAGFDPATGGAYPWLTQIARARAQALAEARRDERNSGKFKAA